MVISFVCLAQCDFCSPAGGFCTTWMASCKRAYWLPSYDVFKSLFRDWNEYFRGHSAPAFTLHKKLFCSLGCPSVLWKPMWRIATLGKFTNNAALIMIVITFKIIIISLVKKSSWTQGRSVESKPKRNRGKSVQGRAREPLGCYPWRTCVRSYSNVSK